MANPKQKRSKANMRSRRRNWKARPISLTTCGQCHQPKRAHYACPRCGYYGGRLAVAIKEEPAGGAAR